MQKNFSIKADIENLQQILEEQKFLFLEKIILAMELPLVDHFPDGLVNLDVNGRMKLRRFLVSFGERISMQASNDGDVKIYFGNNLIAELFKPEKILSFDKEQKKNYFNLNYRYTSLFEKD